MKRQERDVVRDFTIAWAVVGCLAIVAMSGVTYVTCAVLDCLG